MQVVRSGHKKGSILIRKQPKSKADRLNQTIDVWQTHHHPQQVQHLPSSKEMFKKASDKTDKRVTKQQFASINVDKLNMTSKVRKTAKITENETQRYNIPKLTILEQQESKPKSQHRTLRQSNQLLPGSIDPSFREHNFINVFKNRVINQILTSPIDITESFNSQVACRGTRRNRACTLESGTMIKMLMKEGLSPHKAQSWTRKIANRRKIEASKRSSQTPSGHSHQIRDNQEGFLPELSPWLMDGAS